MSDTEQEVMDRWWKIQKGDVVIDGGCNTGLWTLPALDAGAFVFSYDADRKSLDGLEAELKKRGYTLRCFPKFVGLYSADIRQWSLVEAWEKLMRIPRSFTEPIIGYQPVPFARIDTIFKGEKLDWIKLDIEGFEYEALKGAITTLKKFHPKMIIENHSEVDHIKGYMARNGVWADLLRLVGDLGYNTTEMPYMGRSHLYCYI